MKASQTDAAIFPAPAEPGRIEQVHVMHEH